nr:unnamed protein product [Callosobruchus analis]
MLLQTVDVNSFKSTLCTLVDFTTNRCYEIGMCLYYVPYNIELAKIAAKTPNIFSTENVREVEKQKLPIHLVMIYNCITMFQLMSFEMRVYGCAEIAPGTFENLATNRCYTVRMCLYYCIRLVAIHACVEHVIASNVGMLYHMLHQISGHGGFITAFCTFAYFASNRMNEVRVFLYYMIVQRCFT